MIIKVALPTADFIPNQNEQYIKNTVAFIEKNYGKGFKLDKIELGHWYRTNRTWHYVKGQIIFKKD